MSEHSPKSKVEKSQKQVEAARLNGALGGFKTAATHSQEWLNERARKGGKELVTRYSTDYYRWVNSQRKRRRGWPLGKLRKAQPIVEAQLKQDRENGTLPEAVLSALEGMLNAD